MATKAFSYFFVQHMRLQIPVAVSLWYAFILRQIMPL